MKKRITYILLLFAVLWSSVQHLSAQIYDAQGQYVDTLFHDHINRQAEDFVTVSLLVADPTDWRDDMMGADGHAFLRLHCPTFDLDYCYSYESEPIEGNLWRALTGKLKMGLFCFSTESQIQSYQKWHRTVHEYKLNLPPDAKQRLWRIMDEQVSLGNMLPMDLFRRGCTITIVHFVRQALDTVDIKYTYWPAEISKSRYEIMEDQWKDYPWILLGAKLTVLDKRFDSPCSNEEKLIVPTMLADVWQKAKVDGKPLAVYQGDLVKGDKVVVEKTYFTPMVALILLLLLIGGGITCGVMRKRKKKAKK